MGGNGPSGPVCLRSVNLAKLWLWVRPPVLEDRRGVSPGCLAPQGWVGWSRQGNAAVMRGCAARNHLGAPAAWEPGALARDGWAGTDRARGWLGHLVRCCCVQSGRLRLCRGQLSGRCLGLADVLVGLVWELLCQSCCCAVLCCGLQCWGFLGMR